MKDIQSSARPYRSRNALFLMCCTWLSSTVAEVPTIHFYSPETNINNFNSLKAEWDTHLNKYQLQPYKTLEQFEFIIEKISNGALIVSSWHFRKLDGKVKISAVPVGTSKGSHRQKWTLNANKKFRELDALKGRTIASAGSRKFTLRLLEEMLGSENKDLVDSLKILTVPKDLDALMCVGFKSADAALTTEYSVNTLREINSKQHAGLRPLSISGGILLPILAVPIESLDSAVPLIQALEHMSTNARGRQCLKMIGLDAWERIGKDEKGGLDL